jgi:LysR family transcriptional activator of dmlA
MSGKIRAFLLRKNMAKMKNIFSIEEKMKIDEVGLWEAFQAVATAGGFSRAAKNLGVGVPQVSKRINKLEDLLGIRLFKRSTRIVKLTDEGRALLPRVTSLLEDLIGLENSFEDQKKLSGTVKVACVPFVAQSFMIPLLRKFMRTYPEIKVHMDLNPRVLNLNDSDFDLAIRVQESPADSNMIYRKLARNQIICCASPKYLKTHPAIKTPADLAHHEVLMIDITGKVRFGDGPPLIEFVKRSRI